MYTEEQREQVRSRLMDLIRNEPCFEGALYVGTGAIKYRDLLSHIGAVVGVYDEKDVEAGLEAISAFCREIDPKVYIKTERARDGLAGLKAFWAGGLSMVLKCGTTDVILKGVTEPYKIAVDKNGTFPERIAVRQRPDQGVRKASFEDPYKFVYAIRRCEMGILRGETIMAEQQLADARRCLLDLRLVQEGDDPHFMRYNELEPDFLDKLWTTYPRSCAKEDLKLAEKNMVKLYREVLSRSDNIVFDETLCYLFDYDTKF